MKPYRLKHKPTGLYYTPVKGGHSNQSNLSKSGKVYLNRSNALIGAGDAIYIAVSTRQYAKMKGIFDGLGAHEKSYGSGYILRAKKKDFEIEFLDITE